MDENEFEFDNEVEELVNQEENLEILGDDCILFDENPEEENPNVPQDTGSAEDDADLVHFEVIEIEEGLEDDGAHFTDLPEPGPSMTRPDVKCVYCDKCFAEKQDLSRHITKDHRGFPIKYTRGRIRCKICRKNFGGIYSLKNHIDRNHPVIHNERKRKKMWKCSCCGRTWDAKSKLMAHMTSHMPGKFFQCHLCFKSLKTNASLINHIKTIHGARQLKCPECFEEFKSKKLMTKHRIIHMVPPFRCRMCKKNWKTRQGFLLHLDTVHCNKTFQCSICSKGFETAKGLKSHLKRHKGKSRISQKQYRDRGSLSNYLFRYQLRRLPVKQETIDSEEKYLSDVTTFSCQYCPRVCLEEHTLQRHIVYSHTGEHACSICGGMFSGRYSLKQHMNSHTRHTAFFTCHICFQTFMKEPLFLRHLKLIHRITRDVTDKTQDDVTILDNNQTAKAPSQSDVDSTKEPNEMELLMPSNIVKIEIE